MAKSKPKTEFITVVLAWLVPDFIVVKEGRRDLGERPTIKETVKAASVIWINKGTEVEIESAKRHIERTAKDYDQITFFVYPTSERDPLGRAKADLLKIVKK